MSGGVDMGEGKGYNHNRATDCATTVARVRDQLTDRDKEQFMDKFILNKIQELI